MAESEKRFDILFECSAVSSGKMRNDITVRWPEMNESYEVNGQWQDL